MQQSQGAKPTTTKSERRSLALKVYAILVEGKTQSVVVERLGLRKDLVSRIAAELVDYGNLEGHKTGRIVLYTKGPQGNKLDAELLQRTVVIDDRGVRKIAPKEHVKTSKVHHKKYRMAVHQQGCLDEIRDTVRGKEVSRPFITDHKRPYHNRTMHYGQIQYNDSFVTVEYEESMKGKTLYIYPPPVELTADQIRRKEDESEARKVCHAIKSFLEAKAGWQLGEPEEMKKWKTHFPIENPVMKGLADRISVQALDGEAWLSNSEGKLETEYSDRDLAITQLELPAEVQNLKLDYDVMSKELFEARLFNEQVYAELTELKDILKVSTDVSRMLVQNEANKVIKEMKARCKNNQDDSVEGSINEILPYDGMMYR